MSGALGLRKIAAAVAQEHRSEEVQRGKICPIEKTGVEEEIQFRQNGGIETAAAVAKAHGIDRTEA